MISPTGNRPSSSSKSKRRSSGVDDPTGLAISIAKTAAKALHDTASTSLAPGVSILTGLLVEIIERAENVRTNKEECVSLATRTKNMMDILVKSIQAKAVTEIDDRLQSDLHRFKDDLVAVLEVMNKLSSRRPISQFLRTKSAADEIAAADRRLKESFEIFQLQGLITIRDDLSQLRRYSMMASPTDSMFNPLLSSTPPAAPAVFFGRDDFVSEAVKLVQIFSPARLAILGPGGIGKTSTALTILYDDALRKLFHNRRYFVSCNAAITPNLLIASILQVVLGSRQAARPDPLTTLHRFLVSSRPLMIVLDNFETPWEGFCNEAESILQRIAVPQVTIILTMRGIVPPSGVKWTEPLALPPLAPLSLVAARQTFWAVSVDHANAQSIELDTLLKEVDCVPLAITLMANLARGHDYIDILKRWRKEKTSMLSKRGMTSGHLDNMNVSISLSVHSARNDTEAIQLLALICHLPDGVIKWRQTLPMMAPSYGHIEKSAAVLQEISLAYVDAHGTFKVLSPIRHYILDNYPVKNSHLKMLENYYFEMIDKYKVVTYGPEFHDACNALLPENANITSIIRNAIETHLNRDVVQAAINMSEFLYLAKPMAELLTMISPYLSILKSDTAVARCHQLLGYIFFMQGHYDMATKIVTIAQHEFDTLKDQNSATQCIRKLGDILYMQGRYEEARIQLNQARAQFVTIKDAQGAAQCLQSLGEILHMENKYSEAEKKLEDARAIFVSIGSKPGAAQCLRRLGDVLYMQDKYDKAKENLKTAQRQFQEMGNKLGATQCLQSLGNISFVQNKYIKAIKRLEEAHEKFLDLGYQLGATQCLRRLGDILCMQGKYQDALARIHEAEEQSKLMGHQLEATQCLQSAGDILRNQMKFPEATEKLQEAYDQFKEIGNKSGATQSMQSLGDVLRKQGKFKEAVQKLQQAQTQFIELEDHLGATECLQSLGNVLRMQDHQYDEAERTLKEAQAQFEKLGHPHGIAQCLKSLGNVYFMEEKYPEATENLQIAKTMFTELGNQLGITQCIQQLGDTLRRKKDYSGARELLQEAQRQFKGMGNHLGATQCQQSLGKILKMEGEVVKARDVFEDALKKFEELEDQLGVEQCKEILMQMQAGRHERSDSVPYPSPAGIPARLQPTASMREGGSFALDIWLEYDRIAAESSQQQRDG